MKKKWLIAALMALGVTAQAQDTTHNLDKDQLFAVSQANKATVIEALTTGFDKQNIDAINQYWHADYIQHAPDFADGRKGLIDAVQGMKARNMKPNREIARIAAENDLVAVHSRMNFGGDSNRIVVDIFRVKDGKLVEHWDTRQAEVTETANGNTMVDGGGNSDFAVSPEDLVRNKENVRRFFEEGFANADIDLLRELMGDEYIQHNPRVPNGHQALFDFLAGKGKGKGVVKPRVKRLVAQGDLVFAYVHYPRPDKTNPKAVRGNAVVDIFRLDKDGKLVEHWDAGWEVQFSKLHANGIF